MSTTGAIVLPVTAAASIGIGLPDLVRARFVLANARAVGVPDSAVPLLGWLKIAGGAGLLLALTGVPLIGPAAAIGLVLFFVGAVGAHVRAGTYSTIGFPGAYLGLSIASLVAVL